MDNCFILHLSLIDGIGPATIVSIVNNTRSDVYASDLYSFSVADWVTYYKIKPSIAEKLVVGLSNRIHLDYELALIEHHSIQWASIIDVHYPELLKKIYMPPAVLYWLGGNFDDSKKHLAVVGARASTEFGIRALQSMIPDLVAAGITVVSGGAFGIDTCAHEATLDAGGKTIAVLGSGLLQQYPASNKKLFKSIIDSGGLVVSDYPLRAEPKPGNFPARNRIISGLSHGTLVVQAAEKSGSLITARYALDQGREIFAVPGPFDDPMSSGCNLLIQSGGAKLVISATDVIVELGSARPIGTDVQKTIQDAELLLERDSTNQINKPLSIRELILDACKKAVSCDDIVGLLELDVMVVQAELFELQLDGKIQQNFSGMWQLVEGCSTLTLKGLK